MSKEITLSGGIYKGFTKDITIWERVTKDLPRIYCGNHNLGDIY